MQDVRARLGQLAAQLETLSQECRAMRASLSAEEARPASELEVGATTAPALAAFLALTPPQEEDALLEVVLRCAMHVTAAGGAGLTLWDASEHRLVFRAAVGDGADGIRGYRVPLEGSIHGLAFATGEIQVATPLHSQIEQAAGTAFHSVLVAPLIAGDQPLGTISAVNKQGARQFTAHDMDAYKWFSDLVAIVVQQQLRQSLLVQALQGQPADQTDASRRLGLIDQDRRLLQLVRALVPRVRNSPQSLALLEALVPVLPRE